MFVIVQYMTPVRHGLRVCICHQAAVGLAFMLLGSSCASQLHTVCAMRLFPCGRVLLSVHASAIAFPSAISGVPHSGCCLCSKDTCHYGSVDTSGAKAMLRKHAALVALHRPSKVRLCTDFVHTTVLDWDPFVTFMSFFGLFIQNVSNRCACKDNQELIRCG